MIYIKPRDMENIEQELRDILDADGWFTLPADVPFKATDFKLAVVKIDNVVFECDSADYQTAYSKHKSWDILQAT